TLEGRSVTRWELLENNQLCSEPASLSFNRRSQQLKAGAIAGLIAIKMALTGDAAHHQRARSHHARPHPASGIDEDAITRTRSDQQVLIQQEKGLHGRNLANPIL